MNSASYVLCRVSQPLRRIVFAKPYRQCPAKESIMAAANLLRLAKLGNPHIERRIEGEKTLTIIRRMRINYSCKISMLTKNLPAVFDFGEFRASGAAWKRKAAEEDAMLDFIVDRDQCTGAGMIPFCAARRTRCLLLRIKALSGVRRIAPLP